MGLKIAILGTRGVPNNYGGFEHIAGYLSRGLIQKGHEVTVYSSGKHPYQEKEWHSVRIIHCFDPEYIVGMAGQFVYDFNCIMDARKKDYDIILMLGYTSSSVWGFLYPKKAIIITNMDGLEWQRSKYSKPVRSFLKYAERLAVQPGRYYVADSPVIREYLDKKYSIQSKYIAYGAALYPAQNEKLLAEYGLKKQAYFLSMARMEPENNIEMVLDGYCATTLANKFIVIGNTGNRFGEYLVNKYKNESRVLFPGAIFDEQKVQALTAFCSLYFHGHSVGGTNPSLLDAMAAKVPIAAHQNPFNKSLLKDNALFFSDAADVRKLIDANQYADGSHINNNYSTIINEFNWNMIIEQYENYFLECLQASHAHHHLKNERNIFYKGQY
jgi:glycosyltransferase involved in cell wall biosynthesis